MRSWTRVAMWVTVVALMLIGSQGATAFAQETHVFNATLSLTGNCSTSAVDPVEDPGCPGGSHPPSGGFAFPDGITTDSHGDIYVASRGEDFEGGTKGRIDIFNSSGDYLTELLVPTGPLGIAVDHLGNIYVMNVKYELLRYGPSVYEPASGNIAYGNAPVVVAGGFESFDVAVDAATQRVFVNTGQEIREYGSVAEGNVFIEAFAESLEDIVGTGLAIDAGRGRIYATDYLQASQESRVRVLELAPPHALIETIDGSTTPAGEFSHVNPYLSLAVNEASGDLFVYDPPAGVVYELGEHGEYLGTISHSLAGHYVLGAQIAVDNGEQSPNGAQNSFGRFLFVPAFQTAPGHTFAFGPLEQCAPVIKTLGFAGVTETEAQLQASVQPCFLETSYTFEYTTEQKFEEAGFTDATVGPSGKIPAGSAPVSITASLEGLAPGTAYRFRLAVSNESGSDEAEDGFATYPSFPLGPCPNDSLRIGASALLPDCRAYELVTPPNASAHLPVGIGFEGEFATREASPAGDQLSFIIEGGGIGNEGIGSFSGDPYRATRGEGGWSTVYTGPDALEAVSVIPGSNSPDQGYSFWTTNQGEGSASIEGKPTAYLHYPDGHSALIGRGSLRNDPRAGGKLISTQGSHVVFTSSLRLEEQAPPEGTQAIYDRPADPETGKEETHVVSLLPEDETPAAGENAYYEGASLDGKGIAFKLGGAAPASSLYLRYDNEKTYEAAGPGSTFAGVAEGGKRVFYLEGGNLFAYEVGGTENPIEFSTSGDVTLVNVSSDGTVAYFVSKSVLTTDPNPTGASAQAGEENLYRSDEGTIAFVGTVTERDVEGESNGAEVVGGLGLWTTALRRGQFGIDPSRTTAEGNVLLFESRADLTAYDPEGHTEIYRFDAAHGELSCISCIATLAPPTGQASLMSLKRLAKADVVPLGSSALLTNLTADGRRAFFQSTEALVLSDNDGLQDVYEWEAQGVGSCMRPGGCVYLISSGGSERADYLYAVSDSGDDVFFRSPDVLLASDQEETPSIYDARVGGGFPEAAAEEPCQGEGCRPSLTQPPTLGSPGLPARGAEDNVKKPRKHCPKGKRRVRRHGKVRCVKHHHRTAGQTTKGAGK